MRFVFGKDPIVAIPMPVSASQLQTFIQQDFCGRFCPIRWRTADVSLRSAPAARVAENDFAIEVVVKLIRSGLVSGEPD